MIMCMKEKKGSYVVTLAHSKTKENKTLVFATRVVRNSDFDRLKMCTGGAEEIRQRKHVNNSINTSWARFIPSKMHDKMGQLLAMSAGSCTRDTRFRCNYGIPS
jgi:hypothetical protein